MRYALIILAFILCSIKTEAQVYQSMPQAGYGPVKRMLVDSVLTIPIGISALRNITGGRDTAQIRYQKSDSSVYVYTGSTWVKLGTGGGGGGSADSTVFFTVYRADTMRANIYGSIPQPDTIYARYPVRISNDTIYLQQAFVDSVYNVSSGDATRLVTTVYNNSGSTITKGSVVYINGRHSSNLPTIALAQANDEVNSYKTFALVETDITTSNSGRVIQAGKIENLNLPTSTYTDGDILYLSPTVPGGYTTTKPLAPNHIVKLGSVTRAHPTLGSIEIKIENGWELAELSDVQIAAVPADSTLLQFSRVDSLWHDVSPVTVLGNRTWKTDGNSSVNSNYFLGSTNNASVRFRTNNTERLIIDSIGRMQMASVANNGTLNNALQLANTNNRSFFNISTGSTITNLTLKANNNSVLDSMVISDSGLIQPRTNSGLWLSGRTTNAFNIMASRCASCVSTESIFAANIAGSAPVFNVLGTGQVSIGAQNPASTAALDITSTSRGLLIPRMTTSQRNAISTPATGLMVWNTDDTTLNQYSGNTWRGLVGYNPSGTINYTAPTQTGSNANGVLNLQQTWNTTGTPTALLLNVTNTLSNANSRLIDLQVGGVSRFAVGLSAALIAAGSSGNTGSITITGGKITYSLQTPTTGISHQFNSATASFISSGAFRCVGTVTNFPPASGNATYSAFSCEDVINQTGGANGITRGLHINPTLTAAADFRAIETTAGQLRMADAYGAGSGSLARSLLDLSQTWNTTGNPSAIKLNVTNTASGSTASLMDLQVGGTSYFTVDKGAKITQFATNTAAGTTGDQTINRPTGTVNIAAAGTTVTVTNNLVTASSLVFAVIRTNDTTAVIKNVVPGAGTFTINLNAAATAETSIGFWVIN